MHTWIRNARRFSKAGTRASKRQSAQGEIWLEVTSENSPLKLHRVLQYLPVKYSPKTMLRVKSAPRKSPFYKKKCKYRHHEKNSHSPRRTTAAMKTEKLMDKYAQLQRTGKLDGFLRKRREKRASKGQKYLPKKVA